MNNLCSCDTIHFGRIMYGLHCQNGFSSVKNLFNLHMRKLINIHLETGGCIMQEKIAVILMVISKGSCKGMIMAAMKLRNITRKYSNENLRKLSSYGSKKIQIMSILRDKQRNIRNQRYMTSGHHTDRNETHRRLSHENGLRVNPTRS